jgi:predicted transcriptional regulator
MNQREERSMTAPHPLHHINRSTLALLRPTELEVLRILWTCGPQTIRTIYDIIAAQRPADYMAVARTVTHLARQGLLDRSADEQWLGGNYRYVARISEREYANA